MSNELQVIDNTELTEQECATLDRNIEVLIESYKNNRQAVNRLVFESVAAMTEGDEYENQLKNKSGFSRFIGSITGSNKELQDKINSSRAAAQYASQQTLQKLAEQNLMSFDLITAVNNKLNASILNIEGEINNIYWGLTKFFKQQRSDIMKLENRIEKIERNVNLLNWQNSIEYQMFNDVEYTELDQTSKIVCLVSDFFEITKNNWTTSDLLLLKVAMATIGVDCKEKVSYFDFIKRIAYKEDLKEKLFGAINIEENAYPIYMLPTCTMQKLSRYNGEESYVVDAVIEVAGNKDLGNKREVGEVLTEKYVKNKAGIDINSSISQYDLALELLFNLSQINNANDISMEVNEEIIGNLQEFEQNENTENTAISESSELDGVACKIHICKYSEDDLDENILDKINCNKYTITENYVVVREWRVVEGEWHCIDKKTGEEININDILENSYVSEIYCAGNDSILVLYRDSLQYLDLNSMHSEFIISDLNELEERLQGFEWKLLSEKYLVGYSSGRHDRKPLIYDIQNDEIIDPFKDMFCEKMEAQFCECDNAIFFIPTGIKWKNRWMDEDEDEEDIEFKLRHLYMYNIESKEFTQLSKRELYNEIVDELEDELDAMFASDNKIYWKYKIEDENTKVYCFDLNNKKKVRVCDLGEGDLEGCDNGVYWLYDDPYMTIYELKYKKKHEIEHDEDDGYEYEYIGEIDSYLKLQVIGKNLYYRGRRGNDFRKVKLVK